MTGNNLIIEVDARIIGLISIADNCIESPNSLVLRSFNQQNDFIMEIPAISKFDMGID